MRLRAGWVSLVAAVLVFGGKLFAWWLTGSTAVLSDALESVVNIVAAGVLVWTLLVAARPADRDHPYGHGKVEFFSAGLEAACIAGAALLIIAEAISALVAGPHVQRLGVGLLVLAGFGAINGVLGVYLVRVGRATRSAALIADGRHVLADVWTTGGVLIGLVAVVLSGWVVLDPLLAIAVAIHVLSEGWRLGREAVAGLMDEADDAMLSAVAERLDKARHVAWIDVHHLRAWRSGPTLHVDLHMVVPRYYDVQTVHRIHDAVEEALADLTGDGGVVVHFDPCRPPDCHECAIRDCPVRSAPLVARPPITAERARRADEAVEAEHRRATARA